MSLMLPSVNSGELSLADVFPSCLSALGAPNFKNQAQLASVRAAVVVLVDGLGALNLSAARGHARFMADAQSYAPRARTVFPSTTAAALATLTTGYEPSEHGMLGYKIRDPRSGEIINQLNGLASLDDLTAWCRRLPLYSEASESGITSHVVSHSRFAATPLTKLIHAGADIVSANTLDERFAVARRIAESPGRHLVVVYISELDEIAHKQGVGSPEWAAQLESVDAALRSFMASISREAGVLLTADHGVIDVPAHKQLLFGDDEKLMSEIESVGGEPRGIQLYLREGASASDVAALWTEHFGDYAWVVTRKQAQTQGLVGELDPVVTERLGDVLVIARKNVVFYDARDAAMSGRQMIGQHGGISDAEMSIPFIKLGAFAIA
ncbi:MAG: hypothetical protein RIR88_917 [Actinomycetota bacterium]